MKEKEEEDHARSNEATLEIAMEAISDEAIHGIVMNWLVPAAVDHAMLHEVNARALVQTRIASAMMDGCRNSYWWRSCSTVGTLTRRSSCCASGGI
jgi:hypothetical protein